MKTQLIKFLLLVVVYIIIWVAGIMIGFTIFPPESTSEIQDPGFDPMLIAVSLLHVSVLYTYAYYADPDRLWVRLSLISFGLSYLITQVESLWFIDAVGISSNVLYGLLLGGLISSVVFSWVLIRIIHKPLLSSLIKIRSRLKIQQGLVLSGLILFVWPMIYFLAGYYIAWQFDAVREYYSGSVELKSFAEMMRINMEDGLYTFQVFRSFIWIGLAYVILPPLKGCSATLQVILTGALFAVLGSSQLLLQNPLMPETVRYVHLIETAISTFLWGGILAWAFSRWQAGGSRATHQTSGLREVSTL